MDVLPAKVRLPRNAPRRFGLWVVVVLGISLATLSAILLNLRALEFNRARLRQALSLSMGEQTVHYILQHDDFSRRSFIIVLALGANGLLSLGIVALLILLNRAYRSLRQQEKLKSEMLRSLAHDANRYMQLIVLNNDLVLEKLEHGGRLPPQAEAVKIKAVQANAEALSRLLANLLNHEYLRQGQFKLFCQPCNLVDLIRGMLEGFDEQFNSKRIQLRFKPADEPVWVWADPDLVRQIVLNLLHNAFKFSPRESEVVVSLCTRANWVETAIQDQGPGIAPEHRQIIFEPFVSLGPEHGTGLGLANARRFAWLLGGKLEVDSPPEDHGAIFRLILPLSRPEGDQP